MLSCFCSPLTWMFSVMFSGVTYAVEAFFHPVASLVASLLKKRLGRRNEFSDLSLFLMIRLPSPSVQDG